jgi:cyclopropane fatty-acyl-phospholipid synthase-like methyltransferase
MVQLNNYSNYVCSEMIEAVGHEYMEDFFSCCESLLAQDGLFVIQVNYNCIYSHIHNHDLCNYFCHDSN